MHKSAEVACWKTHSGNLGFVNEEKIQVDGLKRFPLAKAYQKLLFLPKAVGVHTKHLSLQMFLGKTAADFKCWHTLLNGFNRALMNTWWVGLISIFCQKGSRNHFLLRPKGFLAFMMKNWKDFKLCRDSSRAERLSCHWTVFCIIKLAWLWHLKGKGHLPNKINYSLHVLMLMANWKMSYLSQWPFF